MKIKENNSQPKKLWLLNNSPYQYQSKCEEKSLENMDTDVIVWRVNDSSFTKCWMYKELNIDILT